METLSLRHSLTVKHCKGWYDTTGFKAALRECLGISKEHFTSAVYNRAIVDTALLVLGHDRLKSVVHEAITRDVKLNRSSLVGKLKVEIAHTKARDIKYAEIPEIYEQFMHKTMRDELKKAKDYVKIKT